jgi:hypothetical protein
MRNESRIGIIAVALLIILNRFTSVSDLLLGLLAGLGICFIIIGSLPEKTYSKLKDWKTSIIRSNSVK